MNKELRILQIEDVPADADLELRELKHAGLRVAHRLVETEEAFREALREFRPQLIISDFSMPHFDGMFALALARELAPDVPFIFVSGTIGEESAIRALKNGATDYVLKDNLMRLPAAVERALRESEELAARRIADARHRATFDNAPIGIVHTDIDTDRILIVNPKLIEMLGYTQDELLRMKTDDILHPDHRGRDRGKYRERMLKGELNSFSSERQFVRKDGSAIWGNRTVSLVRDAAGNPLYFIRMVEDITERKSQELRIRRLNRIHEVLSGINSAIVRIRDRRQLFAEACRIAVEHGKFTMSWIGMLDEATQAIKPIARMGRDDGYLERLNLTIGSENTGNLAMAVEAIARRSPVLCNDIATDGRMRPWRAAALERGYRSSASFPLLLEQQAVGVFVLYAPEPGFFDEEEMRLLNEVAGDIAFGLEHIAGQERIEKLSRVRVISSEVNAAIVRIRDRQQLFEEACRIAVEHGNFGLAWIGLFDPATLDVTPVASAGLGSEEMRLSKTTARADVPQGQGVLGRAIRESRPMFDNDISVEKGVGGKRRQEALRLGYHSLIVLPLFAEGAVAGILALFEKEPNFFDEEEIKLLAGLAGNISFALEHIAKEEKLEKLSRIRAVLGEINAAIARVLGRQELLDAACRIAVEQAGFPLAWIGMLDPAARVLKTAAMAGTVLEYGKLLQPSVRGDIPHGQGTNGRAFREKKPIFENDMAANPNVGVEREAGIKHGILAALSMPLLVEGAPVGVMGLYAKEKDYFDEEELSLLTEVAGNISFALEHMARQEKIEKLSRIRALSGEINAAIVRIRERESLLRETCRIAAEHGKFEFVWVALLDQEKQQVLPVAWTGFSPEAAHAVSWASISAARGTLGEAIQTRKAAFRNDMEIELTSGKLRLEALEKGCSSTVCLPFVTDGRVAALIVLFAPGRGFFDEDELALLNELAADVSFALQSISHQEKLEYLSYYDALTGLPNRQLFVDRLSQQMRSRSGEPRMVALVLLDIERLRNINETLGRHGGDELLRLVARRLEHAFNGPDYIARIGADGFGVVIRAVRDATEIALAIEGQVLACFKEPFLVNGKELRVAAKTGIAMFPTDGGDADTLFKNAEAALRKAKDTGERFLFYAAEMNAQAAQSLSLETRLRKAVEAQQFVLHYQPKVELASGRVCGLEALIRWNDPETGLVPPGSFIPLLEETGLILEVGRWALAEALAQHRDWTARGCTVPRIAVNVSAIQLQQKDYADIVIETVRRGGNVPEAIELEITESLLMKDIEASIRKLAIVRGLGIHIAMDDFGTGHSSLSYLARLPINSLKIDRSFINGMTGDGDDTTIVSTIITLAHSLNLRVVAEGVETEEQAQLLRLLKCDEMQGYLFSRPLPAAEVEAKYLAAAAA